MHVDSQIYTHIINWDRKVRLCLVLWYPKGCQNYCQASNHLSCPAFFCFVNCTLLSLCDQYIQHWKQACFPVWSLLGFISSPLDFLWFLVNVFRFSSLSCNLGINSTFCPSSCMESMEVHPRRSPTCFFCTIMKVFINDVSNGECDAVESRTCTQTAEWERCM